MSYNWDFVIRQGELWKRTLESKDSLGNPVPIQAPGFMDIRTLPDTIAPVIIQLPEDGSVVFDTPAGKVTLTIPLAVTSLLLPGKYFHDIWVHNSLAEPELLASGIVVVKGRVST